MFSFIIFFGAAILTLNKLKVNRPVYQNIIQGKDLIADILPPPEYIIESYLVALHSVIQFLKVDFVKLPVFKTFRIF